jgi:exonuclease SbcC
MFADFLTSDFRERKEIIEKLYRGEKLKQLNPKLREKINLCIREKDQLEAKKSGLTQGHEDVLEIDEINDLAKKLETKKNQREVYKEASLKCLDALKLFNEHKKYIAKSEELKKEIGDLSLKLSQTNQTYDKLEKEIEDFFTSYDEKLNKLIKVQNFEEENAKIIKKICTLDHEKEKFNKKQQELNKANSNLENKRKKLLSDLKNLNLSPKEIIKEEKLEALQYTLKEFNQLTQSKHLNEQKLSGLNKQKQDLKLKNSNLSKDIDKFAKRFGEINGILSHKNLNKYEEQLLELNKLKYTKDEIQKEIFKIDQNIKTDQGQLSSLEQKLATTQVEQNEINTQIKDLKKLIDYEKLILAKNLCIHESNEAMSCAICSTPLEARLNPIEFKEIDNDYNERLDSLNQKNLQVGQSLALTKNNIKQYQSKLLDYTQKKKDLKSRYALQLSKFNSKKLKDPFSLDIDQLIQEHEHELRKLKDLSSEKDILNTKLEQNKELLNENIKSNDELQGLINQSEKELTNIQEQIDQLSENTDFKLVELEDILKKNNNYFTIQASLKQIDQEFDFNLTQSNDLNDRLKQLNIEKAELQNNKIKNLSFIKEHCPDGAANEMITKLKDHKNELDKKKKEIQRQKSQLDEDKVTLSTRLNNTKEQIQDIEKLFNINLLDLASILDFAPWNEYQIMQIKVTSERPLIEVLSNKITHHFNQIQEEYKISYEKYVKEKSFYDQTKQKEKEIQAINDRLNSLEKELAQWEELYTLIGKDEFRNYILAIVERNLIKQTNIELEKLCDSRYQIEHMNKNNKSSQDFYIKDRLNADELRKVSTLSGGETFMVSLAMALALAELSRGEAELDSFFIDEGFGTLDQDSLEDVFSMLNDMQNNGKQIGLISHIKHLTERIPININLSKNRMGNSEVNIIYN